MADSDRSLAPEVGRAKVTLVLSEEDALLLAWACDEMGVSPGQATYPEGRSWQDLWDLRDRIRSARRHGHGRSKR